MLRAALPLVAAAEAHRAAQPRPSPRMGLPRGGCGGVLSGVCCRRRWPSTAREARKVLVPPQLKPSPWGELAQALFLGPRPCFWGPGFGAWRSGPSFPKQVAQGGSEQRVEPAEPVSLLHTWRVSPPPGLARLCKSDGAEGPVPRGMAGGFAAAITGSHNRLPGRGWDS